MTDEPLADPSTLLEAIREPFTLPVAIQKSLAVIEKYLDGQEGYEDADLMLMRVSSYLKRGLRECGIEE